jgi:hypothetical protein
MKITFANITDEPHPLMRRFRVWLEDAVEEKYGFWWYCVMDENQCLFDPNFPDEERDSLQWYIDHGYKVEEL